MGVKELKKPTNVWCGYCAKGHGCTVYRARPDTCQEFKCLWLMSQTEPTFTKMDASLRPDRCKAIFVTQDDQLQVHVDPATPFAYKAPLVEGLILRIADSGIRVVVTFGDTPTKMIYTKREGAVARQQVRVSPSDKDGVQTFAIKE
jgi:hypothetical protein